MKSLFRNLTAVACLMAMVLSSLVAPTAFASTTANYPPASPVTVIPFHLSGQYTATATGVVKFKLPFKARVLSVQATARTNGASTPTLTVDVLNGSTSMLSAPISITSGTVSFGTITTAAHADESTINVNLAIGGGGGSPTWNDITVVLTVLRL